MGIVADVLGLVVWVFLLLLFVRLVFDWIQVFARDWRPRGVVLVVAEAVYTVTDPPLKAIRRVIRPVTIGMVRIDIAFMVLVFGCWVLLAVLAMF
ncbi:YggT family protein [Actinotalea fermentans]|uniref:YggT family protein n=1 Tax=Actinotalea fermentans TaxID=43671 RepID=A0A511YVL5_9CELL|nr:YggT family protein [Actinotalea fermentans]KGM16692.1 membrane protein [Actinotalea fermentans ATCC 43279 = JCM 9966 = DSM 3133]GEN79230.1 YggT family protein [Actinotalea fermentans]